MAVFGLGASGIATAKALLAGGAEVVCSDDSAAGMNAATDAGLATVALKDANWAIYAALILAPGIPLTHPEPHWAVRAARLAGVEVIGDLELFVRERRRQDFDVPLIAITGTNGKSTTTALVGHLLREAGRDVQVGGNIGTAMLALEPFAPGRHYVIECSSYQIDLAPSLDASVGVLLNVTPDHLDRHGTIDNYAAVKAQLVLQARHAVIGVDDDYCRAIADKLVETKGADAVLRISSRPEAVCDVGVEDGDIVLRRDGWESTIAGLAGIGSLRGAHNAENACAAAAALLSLPQPLKPLEIDAGMKTFPGLAHRMEQLGRVGGTLFVNNSKATNADSTEKALLSFKGNIFWIAGGKPKAGGIAELVPCFDRVAKAYLIGEATDDFAATLEGKVKFDRCGTLEAATAAAARDAAASLDGATAEPVVLLSPACASFDQFRNFEVRGDAFRALVAALPGFAAFRGAA